MSYPKFLFETKTDAAERAASIGWVISNVLDVLQIAHKAVKADSCAGDYMGGVLVMAQESLDSILGEVRSLEKEIEILDPPKQLTQAEIEEYLRKETA